MRRLRRLRRLLLAVPVGLALVALLAPAATAAPMREAPPVSADSVTCPVFLGVDVVGATLTVDGGAPPAGLDLQVCRNADAGMIYYQVINAGETWVQEIGNVAGVTASTAFAVTIPPVAGVTTSALVAQGYITGFSRTVGGGWSIEGTPRGDVSYDTGAVCSPPPGTCDSPEATLDYKLIWSGSIMTDAAMTAAVDGAWVATNAQAFSFSASASPTGTPSVDVALAGPHTRVGGIVQNEGLLQLFLPTAVLTGLLRQAAGAIDPSQFEMLRQEAGATEIVDGLSAVMTDSGLLCTVTSHFSAPKYRLRAKAGSGGAPTGPGGGGSPPPVPVSFTTPKAGGGAVGKPRGAAADRAAPKGTARLSWGAPAGAPAGTRYPVTLTLGKKTVRRTTTRTTLTVKGLKRGTWRVLIRALAPDGTLSAPTTLSVRVR